MCVKITFEQRFVGSVRHRKEFQTESNLRSLRSRGRNCRKRAGRTSSISPLPPLDNIPPRSEELLIQCRYVESIEKSLVAISLKKSFFFSPSLAYFRGKCDVMVQKLSELSEHVCVGAVLDVVGGVEADAHVARVGEEGGRVGSAAGRPTLNLVSSDAVPNAGTTKIWVLVTKEKTAHLTIVIPSWGLPPPSGFVPPVSVERRKVPGHGNGRAAPGGILKVVADSCQINK